MAMRWQLLIASLLLTGCSLEPFDFSSGGGAASPKNIGAGMYRIPLRPRGPSNCASPDECTLVGAAEAAKGLGATHFMIVPGHGSPSQNGFAYIKVFTLKSGEILPSRAVSVDEILLFLDKRPSTQDQANPTYSLIRSGWATSVVSSSAQ
jgi:hypothetical protein